MTGSNLGGDFLVECLTLRLPCPRALFVVWAASNITYPYIMLGGTMVMPGLPPRAGAGVGGLYQVLVQARDHLGHSRRVDVARRMRDHQEAPRRHGGHQPGHAGGLRAKLVEVGPVAAARVLDYFVFATGKKVLTRIRELKIKPEKEVSPGKPGACRQNFSSSPAHCRQ